jgi:hypothetical protein
MNDYAVYRSLLVKRLRQTRDAWLALRDRAAG